ncbi:TOMM system kinase/cyclase fusion protein [Marinibactrum halimedae]|uniref:Protein kinase n=1 Tax=Marinibactrum halimedae TaxID=1444977 RepID=A0AA37T732_9GAMM|nr:TOMM system kinase/cyclase fusion protein [Marinibactrum halimedae]MCD9460963.1 TOMM system kinase/cyclase fusion protein [Marinibactrum halimedae]GLS28094.1 protein kinase [Marinibactrum halimedae]
MPKSSSRVSGVFSHFESQPYQLLEKIGEGGFGQVFSGEDRVTGQKVAVKVLSINPNFDDEKKKIYLQRFDRETLIGSRLEHPNIVKLIDKGQCAEDLVYAVFEFVHGHSLKEQLFESGPLSPPEAASVMSQVLKGLSHAHEQGVVHRDIKPANIMLTKVGGKLTAKVLDFGIGALMHEARQLDYKSLTLTHETLGTPSYSSPEQLRGDPPTLKTDLYVWGLVFIECITGQPAISGSNVASVFHQQLSPSNIALPAGLVGHPVSKVLRGVLSKNVNDRSSSAHDVLSSLRELNFSTLIGSFGPRRIKVDQSGHHINASPDETLIDEGSFTVSNLTERNQISVLCLTLSIKTTQNEDKGDDAVAHSGIQQEAIDHEILDALHRDRKSTCNDIALRFGATHAGTLGDTQLFYFGYPVVSDNDSRLCARAALEMISDLNKRNAILKSSQGIQLEARMGVHTGMVVSYADTIPEGDTPNIAMELSRMALPDHILCSETTRKALDHSIEFESYQAVALGVDSKPTPLFFMTGERRGEAFGFLRANRQNAFFVGRENEISLIQDFLSSNEDSKKDSCYLHIYGEAGIGKSRLIHELRLHEQNRNHFIGQCLPEYKNNALYPVLKWVTYKYSLDALSPEAAVAIFKRILINQMDEEGYTLPLLCDWLNIQWQGDTPFAESENEYSHLEYSHLEYSHLEYSHLEYHVQRQLLFNALSHLLMHQLSTEPTPNHLLILEDVHWADPATQDFLEYFAKRLKGSSHKVISTSREPLKNTSSENVTALSVPKLSEDDTSQFIERLFDKQAIAKEVMAAIVQRTDGIPLFVEELVGMLLSKKLVHKINGAIHFVGPSSLSEVPTSLLDSLQQRLDGLVYAKETVQLAATIGREFSDHLLKAASTRTEMQIQADLAELVDADLIFIRRQTSGDHYLFKHALVRDAAYDRLTKESQRTLHGSIAVSMEKENTSSLQHDRRYESTLVALHFQQAEEFQKASSYWQEAAQTSIRRANTVQATSHLNNAIECITQLPRSEEVIQQEIEVRKQLGTAYSITHGYASESVTENQAVITQLLSCLDNPTEMFTVLWVSAINHIVGADYGPAQTVVDELVALSHRIGDAEAVLPAALMRIGLDWHQGKFLDANTLAQTALSEYDFHRHHHLVQVYTYDPGIAIMIVQSLVVWALGEKDQAQTLCETALSLSRQEQHAADLTHTLVRASQLAVLNRQVGQASAWAEEAYCLSCEHDLGLWKASAQVIRGWGQSFHAASAELLASTQEGFDALCETGTKAHLSWYQTLLAETYFNGGETDKALSLLEQAIATAKATHDVLYLVETYRLSLQIMDQQSSGRSAQLIPRTAEMLTLLLSQQARGFLPDIKHTLQNTVLSILNDQNIQELLQACTER